MTRTPRPITAPDAAPGSAKGLPDMFATVRRLALMLASSTGVVAATTLSAHALGGNNHCEPSYR
jgi:hypothetical protein